MHPPPVIIKAPPTPCRPPTGRVVRKCIQEKKFTWHTRPKKKQYLFAFTCLKSKSYLQECSSFLVELVNLSRRMKNMYFRDIFQRPERLKTFTHVSRKSPFCRGPHFTYSVHFSPTHKHTPHNIVPKFLDSTL